VPKQNESTRACSKSGCTLVAAFTLTYDYDDQVAALGPLSPSVHSEGYDLCRPHALSFSAPSGWHIIRHLSLTGD
jgi:hypothetical protein